MFEFTVVYWNLTLLFEHFLNFRVDIVLYFIFNAIALRCSVRAILFMCLPGQPILLGSSIMSPRLPYLFSTAHDTAVHRAGSSLPFYALVICCALVIIHIIFISVVVVFGFNYFYLYSVTPCITYYYIILCVTLWCLLRIKRV